MTTHTSLFSTHNLYLKCVALANKQLRDNIQSYSDYSEELNSDMTLDEYKLILIDSARDNYCNRKYTLSMLIQDITKAKTFSELDKLYVKYQEDDDLEYSL